ncbi:MAG: response regulator [Calditrichaeota bacterium]|nr:response regulator [Calditrichota bacterium]HQU71761.1 response regulator [Calditrichia bacterium]
MISKAIRVLYVDDSRLDRELVRDALSQSPDRFELIETDSPDTFETNLSQGEYDIILTDFNILGFSGLEVLELVQDRRPDTPVILVTGTGSEEIAVEAMRRGATDYVIKTPRHIRRLPELLKAALEKVLLYRERERVAAALQYRIEFEQLTSRLAADFLNCEFGALPPVIHKTLETIGNFLKLDRGYVFLFSADPHSENLRLSQSWAAKEGDELPEDSWELPGRKIKRLSEKIATGGIIANPPLKSRTHINGEVPGWWPFEPARASILVPLRAKEQPIGFWGFDDLNEFREWDEDTCAMLRFVGDILASAVDRHNKERELIFSEARYRTLFEESNDVIFISTPDGRFLDINPAGVKLFGYESRDDLLNIDISTELFVNPKEREQLKKDLFADGAVQNRELLLKKSDGTPLTVLSSSKVVWNSDGHPILFRGILKDISELKRLQQKLFQVHKMEALGTLAGGIAHDFNNLLMGILGYTEMVLTDLPEGKSRQNLLFVHTAAERAKELVHRILTFSRQSISEPQPVQMRTIASEAIKLVRATIPKHITVRQDLRETPLIMADPAQLHRIVMNLLTNAIQSMEGRRSGKLGITIDEVEIDLQQATRDPELHPGNYVRLTVSDTGCGMAPEVMERIFEPFYTTKSSGKGTGMGLAVLHGAVKTLNGTIRVHSEPGKGSTFEILLPGVANLQKTHFVSPGSAPIGSERIFLVDDENLLLEMGYQMLGRMGYEVTTFSSGKEALKKFAEMPETVDLVITDLMMPEMSGLEVAREFRKIRGDVPVILMTGFSEPATPRKAKQAGVKEILIKPIASQDLGIAIRRILDQDSSESA